MKHTVSKNSLYEFQVDVEKNRIYFTPVGDWDSPHDVPNYIEDINKCINMVRSGYTVLSDITHLGVPSPEVNNLHSEAQEMMRQSGQRKAAIVNRSMTMNIHLDKVYDKVGKDQFQMGTFNNLEDAEKWLDT
ncbi:MAG: hypothetical protein JW885_07030 [Deltaproteobacteria bacterium]|nr:hypothetical protein [Candidatus Zymogenaceae bacterium]